MYFGSSPASPLGSLSPVVCGIGCWGAVGFAAFCLVEALLFGTTGGVEAAAAYDFGPVVLRVGAVLAFPCGDGGLRGCEGGRVLSSSTLFFRVVV